MELDKPAAWKETFEAFMGEFANCYRRSESRESSSLYVRGLLAEVARKNCWQLAEAVGLERPKRLERLLNEGDWQADEVCQRLRGLIKAQFGFAPGVGVIDESGFVKKGEASAGVARQYCGRLGKVENCQVGVFLGYVSPKGHAFLDRHLYLPKDWCEDKERLAAAKIPEATQAFKTKPQIALDLLKRSWSEGVPIQWVVADTTYGNSPGLRQAIAEQGRYYVMELGARHQPLYQGRRLSLKALAATIDPEDWLLFSRMGEKGPLAELWTGKRVIMHGDDIGEQWLLLRRTSADQRSAEPKAYAGEFTCYLCNAPADTSLVAMVSVAWARHDIEQLLKEGKHQLGMADYEVRSWHGWHRHMTLSMLAHGFLAFKHGQQQEKKPLADVA
jgi:SRSO17 transposase